MQIVVVRFSMPHENYPQVRIWRHLRPLDPSLIIFMHMTVYYKELILVEINLFSLGFKLLFERVREIIWVKN